MESTGTDDNGSVQEYSFSLEFASPTAARVGPGVVLAGLHGSIVGAPFGAHHRVTLLMS
jgi:hypothetical protein